MSHKVRLLGAVDVELDVVLDVVLDAGSAYVPAPRCVYRPRKVALLTYLLLTNRPVRRLEIAALLWPDADARRGRGSLNQLMVEMRREFGTACFITRDEDEIAIAHGAFECDASDLERAYAAGRFEDVVAGYTGPLLDGFATTSLDVFADWLSRARNRIDDLVADAALQSAARSTDTVMARRSLDTAALLRPYDESILRRRMTVAADSGNVAEAVAMFESHRTRILAELGVSPAAETRKLAIAISSREEDASVELPVTKQPDVAPHSVEYAAQHTTQHTTARAFPRRMLFGVAAAVVFVTFSVFSLHALKRDNVQNRRTVDVALITAGEHAGPALRALPGLVATYLIRDSSINLESANSANGFQVVADLSSDNDEISGTVQIRNHGLVIASTALHSSMRLGMDTIAAELARYVTDVVSPTESYASPKLAVNAARTHLMYSRADYARGVRSNAALELHRAELQLDSVGHGARDADWHYVNEAVAREREWQSRGE
jgi:DNA-binding SARP family transcriptional activator